MGIRKKINDVVFVVFAVTICLVCQVTVYCSFRHLANILFLLDDGRVNITIYSNFLFWFNISKFSATLLLYRFLPSSVRLYNISNIFWNVEMISVIPLFICSQLLSEMNTTVFLIVVTCQIVYRLAELKVIRDKLTVDREEFLQYNPFETFRQEKILKEAKERVKPEFRISVINETV